MDDVARFLNTPLGLLLAGSLVSGLIVQFIVSRWQRQNWIFQQQFTERKARLDKRLDAQYGLLVAINAAVAKILTHSQNVVVGYMKGLSAKQMTGVIEAYNTAVDEWEMDARGFRLQLQVYFPSGGLIEQWDLIKKQRDELDVALWQIDAAKKEPADCLTLINTLSAAAENLARLMFGEISRVEEKR